MDKKDIAALLDGLCERPLADGKAVPAAELQAFCGAATTALSRTGDIPAAAAADDNAQADRLRAALATVLSGDDLGTARHIVEDAALQSAAFRLDAQSALAFVDAVEQAPLSAPAHLVDEMMTADAASAARSTAQPRQTVVATIVSLIARGLWSARHWRMVAAACTVLLVAGAASWSVYWQRVQPRTDGAPGLPMVTRTSTPPVRAASPAPPKPAAATAQPCESRGAAGETAKVLSREPSEGPTPTGFEAGAECSPGHQFADRPAEEIEAIAARARLEAARQAAAERAAAEAAGKVGAARAGSEQSPVAGDRVGPLLGATGRDSPAAATSVPSSPSQYGVAPPPAAPAVRPNAVGR